MYLTGTVAKGELLTVGETLKILGVSQYVLNQCIAAGKITPVNVLSRQYFKKSDIETITKSSSKVDKSIEELTKSVQELSKKVDRLFEHTLGEVHQNQNTCVCEMQNYSVPKMLSITEAIKYSGLPENAIRKLIREKKLHYRSNGKKFFVSVSDLDELITIGEL